MSSKERLIKKLEYKIKSFEIKRLMKNKDSDDYKTKEEVFDRTTLVSLYGLMSKGSINDIHGVIKTGKESRIYWGKDDEQNDIAIKIYFTLTSDFRKGKLKYIIGDPRFKNVKKGVRSLTYLWARKEFRNLISAYNNNIAVPKPINVEKNILIMSFIGKDGISAPTLKESTIKDKNKCYRKILLNIKKLYKNANLVHGDLSEYNIMIWKNKPIFFDFSQAVSIKHPNASQFLFRDIENINNFFKKIGVKVISSAKIFRGICNEQIIS